MTKSDNKLDLIYKPQASLEYYQVFPKPNKRVRFEPHMEIQEYYREGDKPMKKVKKHSTI